MKLFSKIFLVSMFVPVCFAGHDEKPMLDAIKRVDRQKVNQFLVPGFFIREADKKLYLAEAQAVTNYTYKRLNYYQTTDLFKMMIAFVKMGLSGLGIGASYAFYKGYWNFSLHDSSGTKTSKVFGFDFPEEKQRLAVYSALGFISLYFLKHGLGTISDVINKRDQWRLHREALANEAIIIRIPVCDLKDACDSIQ